MAIQISSSAAVTSAGITDDTIVNADINTSAAIDESKVASLVTDLAAKLSKASNLSDLASASTARTNLAVPPSTRTVTAGTGLTGGGDLSADRTLTVAYGTTSGTAAQGNDTRITGALQTSLVDAKGDLLVGTADDTVGRLAVVADNTALLAPSSGAAGGMAWSTGPTITGEFTARDLKVTGMTGAVNPGRFVGVTASGAPSTGTFAVSDYVVDQSGQMFVCTVAGTPGTWVSPQYSGDLLTTGEETFPRLGISTASVASTTQTMRLTYFTARKSETTTQVRMYSGGTAAAATPTLCRIGLYTIASNGDGTLVASTANDTTLFAATSTAYTRSWSVSYAKVAGQRYALGVLVVTSAAAPTYLGFASQNSAEVLIAPALSTLIAGSDLPSSFVAGGLSASGQRVYAAILP